MLHKRTAIITALISLLFISLIWQFAEVDFTLFAERMTAKLTGRPFNQVQVLDEKGIPVQIYRDGIKQYNPLFIAKEAQSEFAWRKLEEHNQRFILLTDWLLGNLEVTDSTTYAPYTFDYPKYRQSAPWHSALTQSVLMNALAQRAGVDRNLDTYKLASNALRTLTPEAGGLSYVLPDSALWFMEYPAETPFYSLSGMISTLIELHKYHELTSDDLALSLFDRGYKGLLMKLPEFDYHGYSFYNLKGVKAGRVYHQRHIKRLAMLNEIRPNPLLMKYHDRWQTADNRPVIWQMILNPRPKRILGFLIPWLALWAFSYYLLAVKHKTEQSDPEHS
ncbi:MAG TPA: D-glucuronyl C5-epimerase family protein [Candidatus Cloacimonadota bacterium]|nr:D-glucuronyl C5-epimerase family protein [Candidatus Cloacimonadota bacterium]